MVLFCLPMPNFHVCRHPLPETVNAHFAGLRDRIPSSSASEAEKRKITQQRNNARRRQRMMSSVFRDTL